MTIPNFWRCKLNREAEILTPKGPVAGSFQHTPWPSRRASEAALLVSRAFAFVFCWFKAIIALSLYLSTGALQHTVHTSIIAVKIVGLKFCFELRYLGPNLRLAQTKSAIPLRSVQTADRVQNADCRLGKKCRLQTEYKMQTENLYCFFVWYVITCQLTTYRVSRNRFSAIIFHDYLHHCGI